MTQQNELTVDALMEEYQNNFWDMVPKLEIKSGIFQVDLQDKTCC